MGGEDTHTETPLKGKHADLKPTNIRNKVLKMRKIILKFRKLSANESIHLACASDMVFNDSYIIK